MDLGTGDGRAALALAEAEPGTLVLAVDADVASMVEVSRRAARPVSRGGRTNVLFVVAAAESPPIELLGVAAEVRILFPWGSLLRGVLGQDAAVAAGIARMLAPGGRATALVSIAARDRLADLAVLDEEALGDIADRLLGSGLALAGARRATPEEVRATRSTWGRRLVAGTPERAVWWLELRRVGPVARAIDGHREWAAV